jgi:hypothetical protein
MSPWVFDPHSGGVKIPEKLKEQTKRRILVHAEKHHAGTYTRLDIRFKNQFCYIDAYTEPTMPRGRWTDKTETREQQIERLRSTSTHLCRLRYCGLERWSLAFYTYSHERYEPCVFASGEHLGTPEEGFDIGAVYLQA